MQIRLAIPQHLGHSHQLVVASINLDRAFSGGRLDRNLPLSLRQKLPAIQPVLFMSKHAIIIPPAKSRTSSIVLLAIQKV
jgi:hypothetical protein